MGSHGVTCYPPLPPAEAGTRFSDPGGVQGRVDLCYVKADRLGFEPATWQLQVQRPTAAPTRIMFIVAGVRTAVVTQLLRGHLHSLTRSNDNMHSMPASVSLQNILVGEVLRSACLYISLSFCLSVRSHISIAACPNLTKFWIFCCMLITCGRGSSLLWRQRNVLCISGFVDDVMLCVSRDSSLQRRPMLSNSYIDFSSANVHL